MATGKKAKTTAKKKAATPVAKKPASKKPALKTAKKTSKGSSPRPAAKTKKVLKPVREAVKVKPAAAKKTAVVAKETKPKKKTAEKSGTPKERFQELRKTLIKKREEIVKEAKTEIAKYISGENRQLVDTALDDGDWAVVDISEDMSLLRLSAHRKLMLDIDETLRKIAEGSYGICEECGEEISERRLCVLPTANLCITCQENKERFEAVGKGEID
ncbi:MAG: TraR/DksA family transcriptional regulator [Nitrospirae bacterium]|nr:TraR/DksA family transcriptional regulator [Nitrospirota bacterium]